MGLSRRDLLKAAAAGTAFSIIGLGRKSARADGPARAKRVLIVVAEGGMRTTMAFNASTRPELNPWGAAFAGSIKLGKVMTASSTAVTYDAPSWGTGTKVPDIAQAAQGFAVIGACDHAPGQPRGGDHTDDGYRMGTGYYGKDGAPGIMTVLSRFLPATSAPSVAIGDQGFCGYACTLASGDWLPNAPVRLVPYAMPQPSASGAVPLGRPIEDALDARIRGLRRGDARQRIDNYSGLKKAMRTYGPVLTQKALNFADPLNAAAAVNGITNQMLLEAVGNITSPADTGHVDGQSAALALRMLQIGSPAVMIDLAGGMFDSHSGERETAPDLYTRFGRQLAGIRFALSRIPDGGGTMLDTTLVVHVSEFGRNSGTTTYDVQNGSDHGGDAPWRYQAHVAFGAGIKPKLLAPTDDANNPVGGKFFSTQALLATICTAAGVPSTEIDKVWPAGSTLYPESGPILDLWA